MTQISKAEADFLNKQGELIERLHKGQALLAERHNQLCDVKDTDPRYRALDEGFKKGLALFRKLEAELMATGWDFCIYTPVTPPKSICWGCTCRNETWNEEKCLAVGLDGRVGVVASRPKIEQTGKLL